MSKNNGRFPVLHDPRNGPDEHTWIPWSVAEQAYVGYMKRYGSRQTLERIAERGGFGVRELDLLVPGWRTKI